MRVETEFEIIASTTAEILQNLDDPRVLAELHKNAASEGLQVLVGASVKVAIERAAKLATQEAESAKNWIRAQRDEATRERDEARERIGALEAALARCCRCSLTAAEHCDKFHDYANGEGQQCQSSAHHVPQWHATDSKEQSSK